MKELPQRVQKKLIDEAGFDQTRIIELSKGASIALAAIGIEPVELTEEQLDQFRTNGTGVTPSDFYRSIIREADRIRFGVEEPEIDPALREMFSDNKHDWVQDAESYNRVLTKAYELGRKSKEA